MNAKESFEFISRYYDSIYSDKDYVKEVSFIEGIFENFGKPKKILELGCGTGNYTKIFAVRGYSITGVDLSESMLRVAQQKCACRFIKGNMRDIELNDEFDACLAMFAVMGYVTTNSDVVKTLRNIHRHLKQDGLFVFDVWNGLAVLRQLPETRVKTIEKGEEKIVRIATPTLRTFEHICEVNYKLLAINMKDRKYKEFAEKHVMRFYFPQEVAFMLAETGFEVLRICPFLDFNGKVDESVWNMTIVAKSVG